jgi:hypothetical protein
MKPNVLQLLETKNPKPKFFVLIFVVAVMSQFEKRTKIKAKKFGYLILSHWLIQRNKQLFNNHLIVMITQISGINQEQGKDRLSEIYMTTFFKVFGFVALWCQVWFWIIVWGAYCQIKRFVHKRDPVDRCCAHCFPCCC